MFITYAQNFEDVLLWRCFKDRPRGFYVDIGANDPVVDSVTKAFYDRGWSGINVEPSVSFHKKLERARPRDINLNVAAGSSEGELSYYEVPDTGLSTMNAAYAARYREEGRKVFQRTVRVATLNSLLDQFAGNEIDFLKIDVEGFEREVLAGLDLRKFSPRICVIESTLPNVAQQNFQEWESLVTDAGYELCYTDGLSRFYVSPRETDLKAHFEYPPNVFDQFIRFEHWSLRSCIFVRILRKFRLCR